MSLSLNQHYNAVQEANSLVHEHSVPLGVSSGGMQKCVEACCKLLETLVKC